MLSGNDHTVDSTGRNLVLGSVGSLRKFGSNEHLSYRCPSNFYLKSSSDDGGKLPISKCVSLQNNSIQQGNLFSPKSLFYEEGLGSDSKLKNEQIQKVQRDAIAKKINYIPFNNTFGKDHKGLAKLIGSNESLRPSDIILNSIELRRQSADAGKSVTRSRDTDNELFNFTLRNSQSYSSIVFNKKENHWDSTLKSRKSNLQNSNLAFSRSLEPKRADMGQQRRVLTISIPSE